MDSDREQIASFTVRLPEALRKQLMVQAESRSRSLNSHIQAILEGHLVESGFAGNKLISQSGRTFQIIYEGDDIPNQRDGGVMGFFFLRELKFDKNRAHFMIGLDKNLVDDWHLQHAKEAIEQVGIALLHFYNRQMEIDHLRWPHPAGREDYDGYRVLSWNDVAPAQSLNQFLELVRTNKWKDPLAQNAGQSQDLRRGRNAADLYR